MPNKIKSAKQFRFLEAAAHGGLKKAGMSSDTAKKMLSHESHEVKSGFARKKKLVRA